MYCARVADLTGRLERAVDGGVHLVVLTLTVKSFELGQLGEQLRIEHVVWRKAKDGTPIKRLVKRYGIVGSLWALHPEFSKGKWHAHLHVVLVVRPPVERLEGDPAIGPDEHPRPVLAAATALAERYCRSLMKAGLPVIPQTVVISRPLSIEEIAKYFPNIWKAGFSKEGGVHALLRAALAGDDAARQAYVELAHTLKRKSWIRGSGILRKRGD